MLSQIMYCKLELCVWSMRVFCPLWHFFIFLEERRRILWDIRASGLKKITLMRYRDYKFRSHSRIASVFSVWRDIFCLFSISFICLNLIIAQYFLFCNVVVLQNSITLSFSFFFRWCRRYFCEKKKMWWLEISRKGI